jgi:hypothetical protein
LQHHACGEKLSRGVAPHRAGAVGGIERRKRNPSLIVVARIADAPSVPLTKLLAEGERAVLRNAILDFPPIVWSRARADGLHRRL